MAVSIRQQAAYVRALRAGFRTGCDIATCCQDVLGFTLLPELIVCEVPSLLGSSAAESPNVPVRLNYDWTKHRKTLSAM